MSQLQQTLHGLYSQLSLEQLQSICFELDLDRKESKEDHITILQDQPYMDVLDNVTHNVMDSFYKTLFGELNSESYEVIAEKQARCEKIARLLFDQEQSEEPDSHTHKIMNLLSNSSAEFQHQSLLLFETVDKQTQREITKDFLPSSGQNPYTVGNSPYFTWNANHRKEINFETDVVAFYMPSKYRYHYWMDQYVDWMLAISQDERWLKTTKLHVQHLVVTDTFSQSMLIELLAHLLHHPTCKELYLMKSKDNAIGLLEDLRREGVQGNSVSETIHNLSQLKKVSTAGMYHPILAHFPLEEASFKGPQRSVYLPLPDTYNKYTRRWTSPFWTNSIQFVVDDNHFSHLIKLELHEVAQITSLYIGSKNLRSCIINECKSLERIHVNTILDNLYIDKCDRIYLLDIPQKPGAFHLGSDLQYGLGSAVDSQSTDWRNQFDVCQERQRNRLSIELGWVGSEGNDFFYYYNYYPSTWHMNIHWFLQQIKDCIDGTEIVWLSEWTDCILEMGTGIHQIEDWCEAYSDFIDFDNHGSDIKGREFSLTSRPPVSQSVPNTVLEAFVSALIEVIDEKEAVQKSEFFNQEVILTILETPEYFVEIFSCVEAEAFWSWTSTLPPKLKAFSDK